MGIQVTLLYTLKSPTPKKKKKKKKKLYTLKFTKKKKYTLKEKNKFVEAAARDIAETSVFILKSWQRWEWRVSERHCAMKRFFKPVEKEGSSKKPSLSQPEKEEDVSLSNEDKGEPSKFMTWNANSFLLRVKNNWPEFTKLVTSFDPDVIAIQVTLLQFLYSLFWCTPFENSVFLVDSMWEFDEYW